MVWDNGRRRERRGLARLPHARRRLLRGWLLGQGHAGPHAALGQADGDSEFWLRWTDSTEQIVALDPCRTPGPVTDGETDQCLLFAGHEGPHDFELSAHDEPIDLQTAYRQRLRGMSAQELARQRTVITETAKATGEALAGVEHLDGAADRGHSRRRLHDIANRLTEFLTAIDEETRRRSSQ